MIFQGKWKSEICLILTVPFPEIRLKTEKKKTSPPSIISSIKTEGQALGVSPVSSLNSWAMGVCFESSEPVVLVFENQNL